MFHPPDLDPADETPTAPPHWRPAVCDASLAALRQLDCFRKLPEAELAQLAPPCSLRVFGPGVVIAAEHSIGSALMVLLDGSVTLTRRDAEGQPVLLAALGRGDVFGEGGLFGSRYRRVTARAETHVILLQIRYAELKPLLPSIPTFAKRLQRSYRSRLIQTTLARTPLFGALSTINRLTLAADLEEQQIDRGEIVEEHIEAGNDARNGLGQGLHIIAEGQAIVERDGRQVAVLNPGDFFGEMELLEMGMPSASIVALTPLHILTLPTATCAHLFRAHPEIVAGMREIARVRRDEGGDVARVEVVEAAIASGVVRGRKVLARIPALCPPGCNLCEQGCASRHGATRIHLNGTAFGALDVPKGCMHCTWSPECVEACPEHALQLGDDGFLLVNNRCTGCGLCAEACDYDAITMIPLYPPISGPLDWMLRRVRRPTPIRMHANKCDGCQGFSDQACLSICPTGSLRWVSADELQDEATNPTA